MLLELSLPMSGDDEVELAAEARAFGDAHILPIAKHLAMTKGVGSKIQPLSVSTRANLFQHHMRYQFGELRSGNLPGQLKTECLFKMASYLEVFAPLKQISEFLGVPITTVEAQVKRARAAGSLPKASEVRGRNKVNKEVH